MHVGSSWVRDRTHIYCTGGQILYHWATREAPMFNFLWNHPTFTFCHFTSYHFTFLPAVHKGSYFILSNIVIFLKIQSTLMSMKWYSIVVLICISLLYWKNLPFSSPVCLLYFTIEHFTLNTSVFFSTWSNSLWYQVGVLQFNSTLTLSAWR